ncbi:MAG: hypothetical protein NWE80_03595, partial [Candidatus Bathyarchaeota archaeon]|nr:hypothetical protein [Candidatus Bathyarchaeota archaeon]
MHVLVIAQLYPPDMGGGATRAQNIVKGLLSSGCKVTVVAAFPHYPYGDIPQKYRWKPFLQEKSYNLRVIRTFVPAISSKGTLNRLFLFFSFLFSATLALPLTEKVDA